MAFMIDNLPSPKDKEFIQIKDFSGGLNNVSTPDLVEYTQLSNAMNVTFADEQNYEKRPGTEAYDATDLGVPITHLNRFLDIDGLETIIKASDTEIYNDTTKIGDVLGEVSSQQYLNNLFYVDGDKLYWYGSIDEINDTNYTMTGWTAGYHTLEVVTPGAFTPLPSPAKIGVWVYDYTAGTVEYQPCELELDDELLGVNYVPTSPNDIVSHGNRLWVSGNNDEKNLVFLTDIDNPFYFPVGTGLGLPPTGDKIIGLKVFMNSVVVGREFDLYVMYGETAISGLDNAFYIKKINAHTGIANKNALDVVHNYLFFLGSDKNVYYLNTTQTNVDVVSTSLLNKYCDFTKEPFNLSTDEILRAKSVFFDNNWYLAFDSMIAVYNYKFQSWIPWNQMNCSSLLMYQNDIVYGRYDGRLAKPSDQFLDMGMPYKAFTTTKRTDLGDATLYKQFRELFVVAEVYLEFDSDIDILFELDYDQINFELNIESKVPRWGDAVFGNKFIVSDIPSSNNLPIGRRGRVIRITAQNGRDVTDTVSTFSELTSVVVTDLEQLAYVEDENAFYESDGAVWSEVPLADLNQPMKVYEYSIQYQNRSRR